MAPLERRRQSGESERGAAVASPSGRQRRRAASVEYGRRHGAATLALAGNVNAELVRRQLGHSTLATTVDLYQRHPVEAAERAAQSVVASQIDAPVSKAFANGGAEGGES